jgi:hypothetical protein
MLLQFRHVDDGRHLYLLDHQYLVRRMTVPHLRLVCGMENLVRQLFDLVVNYLLAIQLLDDLVADELQNLGAQNLDAHLTLVDVHLVVVVVVQVDVALHLFQNQKDCCRHVVDVALLERQNRKRCCRHVVLLALQVWQVQQVHRSLVALLEFHFELLKVVRALIQEVLQVQLRFLRLLALPLSLQRFSLRLLF